ncbi:CBS domain-containing protein [Lutibacter sp. HS1-25]|uniref:CBS domain-containing protein n=1 Tax=Lutibacter sp. HS1-25 TaxID=2485000 RepID=UPI001012E0EE|nr:CBS domain-containing protein [Lutibacter sp. HS1-25]RXP63572.1 CBS domain-containing protein [Lutibacter sp. HS1-25]
MKSNLVTKIMTKNVVCVSPEQSLLDVKHIYEKKEFHHHIPVTENEKLVGIVSLIDFMYNIAGAGLSDDNIVYSKLKVKDIMTKHPFYLTTNATIKDVSEVLAKGNYHAVPIVEEDKKIVGIVSTADVIKFLLTAHSTSKII